jgi:hypothetical protein
VIYLFFVKRQHELKKACHYINLQPLWAIDNFRKDHGAGENEFSMGGCGIDRS